MEDKYEMGYQRFKYGKNKPCFKGFCVKGPDPSKFVIFLYQTIATFFNLVWYTYLAPYHFRKMNSYALPIVTMILGIFLYFMFNYVTFADPGFLLRHSNYDELSK